MSNPEDEIEVIRSPERIEIPKETALDPKLDIKAKGVLMIVLALPPWWKIRRKHLFTLGPDCRTAVTKAMERLREAGYMRWKPARRVNGKYVPLKIQVRDSLDLPWCKKPVSEIDTGTSVGNRHSNYPSDSNPAAGVVGVTLGIKDTSFIQTSVDRFTQFAIENNLISKKPFTRKWISAMSNLLADHDRDIVSKTLDWFLDHRMTYKHVAQVKTLPLFCQRFAEIIEAHRRWLKENPEKAPYPTKKRMKQVEVDGKMTFIEVTQWTSEE